MTSYRDVLGKVEGLQRGFTSGTAAQAASKAALLMLISKDLIHEVSVTLNGGLNLVLPVINQSLSEESASCGIIKDSGDDSDITHGHEFRADVQWSLIPGIEIIGGTGVGTVTKEGLPVKPGHPAINPNPRRMILGDLEAILPGGKGIRLTISVPDGESLARDTWNPRLGVTGGISIIGTSGIIEPKSSKAYKASIALSANVIKKSGNRTIYITPGYVGEGYLTGTRAVESDSILKVGDHMGFALDTAAARDFEHIYYVGHIGKMAKIASGIFNTHCKYGDARLETVAAFAAAAGASREEVLQLLEMKMAEAAVPFLEDRKLEKTFDLINQRIIERSLLRIKKEVHFTSVILDLKGNVLSELSHG